MLSFIARGGIVMIPIAALSVAAVALIVEKIAVLVRHPPYRGDAGSHAAEMLRAGRGAELVEEMRLERAPEARVILAGLSPQSLGRQEREALMEVEAVRVMASMEDRVSWLSSIANIATLLGLLGTVTGMIRAFAGVKAAGYSNPTVLSGGISEALITTAAGLVVAVPSLLAYHLFANAVGRAATRMELAAASVVSYMAETAHVARAAKTTAR
jgi:biopolymer transport protein ExbB